MRETSGLSTWVWLPRKSLACSCSGGAAWGNGSRLRGWGMEGVGGLGGVGGVLAVGGIVTGSRWSFSYKLRTSDLQ